MNSDLKLRELQLEVVEVEVKVLLAVLQGVVGLLLQRGDKEAEAGVVRLQALDVGQAETLVGREDVQES